MSVSDRPSGDKGRTMGLQLRPNMAEDRAATRSTHIPYSAATELPAAEIASRTSFVLTIAFA